MSTKIQINSLEALERLIGNDTELEIQVRNTIVQEFAKKHLKAIANETSFQNEITVFKQKLQNEFDKRMEESIASVKRYYYGGIEAVTLHPEIKSAIDRQVREKVDGQISEAVECNIKHWEQDAKIDERVQKRMDYYVTQHINQEVKKRLEELAKKLTS